MHKILFRNLKNKLNHLYQKRKKLHDQVKDCEVVSNIKKDNEIIKHELEISNMKMSMMEDEKKSQTDLRTANANL